MKKTSTLSKITAIIAILALLGNIVQYCMINQYKDSIKQYESYSPLYEVIPSLTTQSLNQKILEKNSFVVYVGRPNCGDCINFEPTLLEIIENNNLYDDLYYFNNYWLQKSDLKKYNKFKSDYGFDQTPVFLYFEDGKLVNKIEWTEKGLPKSDFIDWLASNNLIK